MITPKQKQKESKETAKKKKIVEENQQKRGGHIWENKQTKTHRDREVREMRIT